MIRFALLGIALILATASHAQHVGHSPYAGMAGRDIKALAPEQIADLRSGSGMSLALAAELNGYPGPAHVLELGDALGLSAGQRIQVSELRSRMTAEARDVGERIIRHEQTLDLLFASRTANPQNIAAATAAIGRLQGELRHIHLTYHLDTYALLSPSQNRRYQELRGYPGAAPSHRRHH